MSQLKKRRHDDDVDDDKSRIDPSASKKSRPIAGFVCSGNSFFAKCVESRDGKYMTRDSCEKDCLSSDRVLPKVTQSQIAQYLGPDEFKRVQATVRKDRLFPLDTKIHASSNLSELLTKLQLELVKRRLLYNIKLTGEDLIDEYYLGSGNPLEKFLKDADGYNEIARLALIELKENDYDDYGDDHLGYFNDLMEGDEPGQSTLESFTNISKGLISVVLRHYDDLSLSDKKRYFNQALAWLRSYRNKNSKLEEELIRDANRNVNMEDID